MEVEFERVLIEGHGTPLIDQCLDPWCRDGIHHVGPLGGWWHVQQPCRRWDLMYDRRIHAAINAAATIAAVALLVTQGGGN